APMCKYFMLISFSFIFVSCLVVFFFQAEDGIRDDLVTGVQTCALPICDAAAVQRRRLPARADERHRGVDVRIVADDLGDLLLQRSEERRVGKECRSGGATYD